MTIGFEAMGRSLTGSLAVMAVLLLIGVAVYVIYTARDRYLAARYERDDDALMESLISEATREQRAETAVSRDCE